MRSNANRDMLSIGEVKNTENVIIKHLMQNDMPRNRVPKEVTGSEQQWVVLVTSERGILRVIEGTMEFPLKDCQHQCSTACDMYQKKECSSLYKCNVIRNIHTHGYTLHLREFPFPLYNS